MKKWGLGTTITSLNGSPHKIKLLRRTRQEFQNWCQSVCSTYGYFVEFDGVGYFKKLDPNIGHCSQIAIFKKKEDTPDCICPQAEPLAETYFVDFPYFTQIFTLEEAVSEILLEVPGLLFDEVLTIFSASKSIKANDLWESFRIRQVCKTREAFLKVLRSSQEFRLVLGAERDQYNVLDGITVVFDGKLAQQWIDEKNALAQAQEEEVSESSSEEEEAWGTSYRETSGGDGW